MFQDDMSDFEYVEYVVGGYIYDQPHMDTLRPISAVMVRAMRKCSDPDSIGDLCGFLADGNAATWTQEVAVACHFIDRMGQCANVNLLHKSLRLVAEYYGIQIHELLEVKENVQRQITDVLILVNGSMFMTSAFNHRCVTECRHMFASFVKHLCRLRSIDSLDGVSAALDSMDDIIEFDLAHADQKRVSRFNYVVLLTILVVSRVSHEAVISLLRRNGYDTAAAQKMLSSYSGPSPLTVGVL